MKFLKIMGHALMFIHIAVATNNQGPTQSLQYNATERLVQALLNQSLALIRNKPTVLPRMRVDYRGEGRKYRKLTPEGIEVIAEENSETENQIQQPDHPVIDIPKSPTMGLNYTDKGRKYRKVTSEGIEVLALAERSRRDIENHSEYQAYHLLEETRKKIADFLHEAQNPKAPGALHTRTEVVENHEPIVFTAEQNAKKIEYITNYGHYKLHEVSKAHPSGQIPEKEIDDATRDIATTMLQYFSFRPSEVSMIKEDRNIEKRDAGSLRKEHDTVETVHAEDVGNKVYKEYPTVAELTERYRGHYKGIYKWLDGTVHPVWEEDPQGGPYYTWPYKLVFDMFKNALGKEMGHVVASKVWESVNDVPVEKDGMAVEEKARKYDGGEKGERKAS